MAKWIGCIALAALLVTLVMLASGGVYKGVIVLFTGLGISGVIVHLVGMIASNDWWPWRNL